MTVRRVLNIGGTGGDLRRMPASINPLTRSFTVLAYDQRCLGQTTGGDDRQPSMADYADDAAVLHRSDRMGPRRRRRNEFRWHGRPEPRRASSGLHRPPRPVLHVTGRCPSLVSAARPPGRVRRRDLRRPDADHRQSVGSRRRRADTRPRRVLRADGRGGEAAAPDRGGRRAAPAADGASRPRRGRRARLDRRADPRLRWAGTTTLRHSPTANSWPSGSRTPGSRSSTAAISS